MMKIKKWNSNFGINIGGINEKYNVSFIIDENQKHLFINNKKAGKHNDWRIIVIEDGSNYLISGQKIENGKLTNIIFDYNSKNNELIATDKETQYCNTTFANIEKAVLFLSNL